MKKANFNAFKAFAMNRSQISKILGGAQRCEWSDTGAGVNCGGGSGTCKVNVHSDGKRCLECNGNTGGCRNNLSGSVVSLESGMGYEGPGEP